MNIQDQLCFLGFTELENQTKAFGILPDDRRRHMYIIGKSGVGKSTLLENMILQDIYAGKGVCFIDPLGDSAESILDRIPQYRHKDVVYLNPADTDNPIGVNFLESQNQQPGYLVSSEMLSVFKKIWEGAWSGRMEYFLSNAILALTEIPGNNILGISKIFTDKQFRKFIVDNCQNMVVKKFWEDEFNSFSPNYKTEAVAAIVNKVNQFVSGDMMRNIVSQNYSTINFRDIMDDQKIFIINLSKGRIGEENARLLGGLIVAKLQMAAMSRVDTPEDQRKDFYMYVDEFQNMISDSFATILSEARKYRLNLILANQYMAQLAETENQNVRNAIFGNVGTLISFQVGYEDAEILEGIFFPKSNKGEATNIFLNLDRGQALVKLYVQSKTLETFFANTFAPLYTEFSGNLGPVVQLSRQNHSRPKAEVELEIQKYFQESLIPTSDGFMKVKAPKRNRKKRSGEEKTDVTNLSSSELPHLSKF